MVEGTELALLQVENAIARLERYQERENINTVYLTEIVAMLSHAQAALKK